METEIWAWWEVIGLSALVGLAIGLLFNGHIILPAIWRAIRKKS